MFYIFDTLEEAENVERIISANMGLVLPQRYAIVEYCNNPANKYYGKYYIPVLNTEKKAEWLKDLKLNDNKKKSDKVPWKISTSTK
jgi:hypothetical protein